MAAQLALQILVQRLQQLRAVAAFGKILHVGRRLGEVLRRALGELLEQLLGAGGQVEQHLEQELELFHRELNRAGRLGPAIRGTHDGSFPP